jgi:probable rRNA maturation factor
MTKRKERRVDSGSPEPSRSARATRATETAVKTPSNAGRSPTSPHLVTVVDDQSRPVDRERLRRLADFVLAARAVPAELELSIACVDTARITELNEAYLGGHGPTDVLAFPIDGPDEVTDGVPGLLGDVVLCPAVAERQAAQHGRTPIEEADLLLVHGILHLLGHDHGEAEERAEMFGLTDRLLSDFAAAEAPR